MGVHNHQRVYAANGTEEFFGIREPIEVIHNFVNCDPVTGRTRKARGKGRKRILHISNFRPV